MKIEDVDKKIDSVENLMKIFVKNMNDHVSLSNQYFKKISDMDLRMEGFFNGNIGQMNKIKNDCENHIKQSSHSLDQTINKLIDRLEKEQSKRNNELFAIKASLLNICNVVSQMNNENFDEEQFVKLKEQINDLGL